MKQLILTVALISATAIGQEPKPTPIPAPLQGDLAAHSSIPTAKPADVNSVDAILSALYNAISGPKGQPRDWDRMRSLFLPSARLIPARAAKDSPHADAIILTIDDYIARSSGTMTASGFFERRSTTTSSNSATSSTSGAPTSPATTPTTPHPSPAASTASSSSRTATATGSSTSSGTANAPPTHFLQNICPSQQKRPATQHRPLHA
jgi:hypothetical protein